MLLLLFAAGFMRSIDHIILAVYLTSSVQFLMIPIMIWTAYLLYVISFNTKLLTLSENSFAVDFILVPTAQQWASAIYVAAIQLLPNFIYGFFLIIISFRNDKSSSALLIFFVLPSQLLIAASLLKRKLIRPDFEQRVGFVTQWISENLVRPFAVICVEWSIRRQPLQSIGLKVVGLALIWITLYLFETDTYDLRLAGLGVTFAFALNIPFVFAAHKFIAREFPLLRQMPFSLLQRWFRILLTLVIFTAPELFVLIRNIPEQYNLAHSLLLYIFGLSINVLIFTFLFARNGLPEKSMPGIYAFIIFTFFSVLGGIAPGLLTAVNAALSFLMMGLFYYRYEPD